MKYLFNLLINKLNSLGIFSIIARYKGEFEEGVDWNPVWPACYIRLISVKPELVSSGREVLKRRFSFSIYIANHDDDEKRPLLDLVDIVSSINKIENIPLFLENISWAGYIKGTEIYKIDFETIF